MPTIEDFAYSVPVGGDGREGLGGAAQQVLGAAQELRTRMLQEQGLKNAALQQLIRRAAAPPQLPGRPGLFGPDDLSFLGAYPSYAQTVLGRQPGGAPGGAGAGPAAAPGLAAALPQTAAVPAQAPAVSRPPPQKLSLEEMGYSPEEIAHFGREALEAQQAKYASTTTATREAPTPPPATPPERPELGTRPVGPVSPMAAAMAPPQLTIRTPEEWAIFQQLMPTLTQRYAADDKLQAALASTEQRYTGNRLTNMVNALRTQATDELSRARLAELAARTKKIQTVDDLKFRMQRLSNLRSHADAIGNQLSQMASMGVATMPEGSAERQMFDRLRLEQDAALQQLQDGQADVDSYLTPGAERFKFPTPGPNNTGPRVGAARQPAAPSVGVKSGPSPAGGGRVEMAPEGVTVDDLVAGGFSQERATALVEARRKSKTGRR